LDFPFLIIQEYDFEAKITRSLGALCPRGVFKEEMKKINHGGRGGNFSNFISQRRKGAENAEEEPMSGV